MGLILWNFRLGERVDRLEQEFLKEKTPKKKSASTVAKKSGNVDLPWELPAARAVKTSKKTVAPRSDFHFEDFLGRKFFAILGIVSIVFAIGFFTVWAFSHGWIGDRGRIAIGMLASLGLVVAGEILRGRMPQFFDKISASGIAGMVVVTFLARDFYGFLSAGESFSAYILEISAGLALALRYNSRVLGNFSILGGLLAPILMKSPEMNATGLLIFLLILSGAGFFVSVFKKWPEILGLLFLGVLGFEISIFLAEAKIFTTTCFSPGCEVLWKTISPTAFLGFVFAIHFLLGSGGIFRVLKFQLSRKKSGEIFEILLFVSSIFVANLFAWQVFEVQNWSHLGFAVLAEGFLFFWLSEIFRKFRLEIFREILVGATLTSILFATIWEIGVENPFVVVMFLIAEGILFLLGGRAIFENFGRVAIGAAFFLIFDIESFATFSVAVATFLAGVGASGVRAGGKLAKILVGLLVISAAVVVEVWSFDRLSSVISQEWRFLPFMLPAIFATGVAFSVIWTRENFSRVGGLIFCGIFNLILWTWFASGEFSSKDSLNFAPFSAWLVASTGNFAVLSTFFIKGNRASEDARDAAVVSTLGLTTIGAWLLGHEFFAEPGRSVFWILWGGILLWLGFWNLWRHFRYFGLAIFCFLIAKWYFVDVWNFEVWVRFLAFLALGVGLLAISSVYSRQGK